MSEQKVWTEEEDRLIMYLWNIPGERQTLPHWLGRSEKEIIDRYYALKIRERETILSALEKYDPKYDPDSVFQMGMSLQWEMMQLELSKIANRLCNAIIGAFKK